MTQKPYRDYGTWIREQFPFRVQKIAIDAGFTCPNRDGKVGLGGCVFCDNATFNPSYCNKSKTITDQLEEGKAFFARKYPDMKYLAYFQAYSNTYAPLSVLKERYEEALNVKDIVGIVIATRPDCIDDEKLDYLAELNKCTFLILEYGVETCNDETLRIINRGHTFECSKSAIIKTHERGILVGAHFILGLPGEDRNEIMRQAKIISSLPIDILKLHQMQIIKGTRLAQGITPPPHTFTVEEYIAIIADFIKISRKDIIYERFVSQSPKDLLIAPNWGLKNHELTNLLNNRLARKK
ncbi:MAG: TIGR01212 family radical SAM protein [Prevotellaceae bacterium]|nr:TIGR01212 family radical SAM protein [Prevotellaceae bacterium]